MVIIISLSFGERREDERNSDYFGSIGCDSSLGCRARASGVGSPVLPIQEMHLAEGRGDHNPGQGSLKTMLTQHRKMKREELTQGITLSGLSLTQQKCDSFLKS